MNKPPAALQDLRNEHADTTYPGDLAADAGLLRAKCSSWRPLALAAAAAVGLAATGWWGFTLYRPASPVPAPIAHTPVPPAPAVQVQVPPSPETPPEPRKGVRLVTPRTVPAVVRLRRPERPPLEFTRWRPERPQLVRRSNPSTPQGDAHEFAPAQSSPLALDDPARRGHRGLVLGDFRTRLG